MKYEIRVNANSFYAEHLNIEIVSDIHKKIIIINKKFIKKDKKIILINFYFIIRCLVKDIFYCIFIVHLLFFKLILQLFYLN